MGQRSQIYIRVQDTRRTALFARYFGWNYGERMVSRARYIIQWLKEYLDNGWGILDCECETKLQRMIDVNFDMHDVVISTDLVQEWRENSCDDFVDYVFHHSSNNDGRLFIDFDHRSDKIRYAFLDDDGRLLDIMDAAAYLLWDARGEDWKEHLEAEDIAYTLANIQWLRDNAVLMTEEQLIDFKEYPYEEKKFTPEQIHEKAKRLLAELRQLQTNPAYKQPYPCPRCGKHNINYMAVGNVLSRYEDVFICPDCDEDELKRGKENILPLENWSMVISFLHPEGSAEMTKLNTSVTDPQFNDGATEVEMLMECWFDWDAKFGTHTADDEDTWLNIYAAYNPTAQTVRVYYIVDDNEKNEQFSYTPTATEKKLLIELIEEYFQKYDGCSVAEALKRFRK